MNSRGQKQMWKDRKSDKFRKKGTAFHLKIKLESGGGREKERERDILATPFNLMNLLILDLR